MNEDLELIQAFADEANELVEAFEQGLLELEASPEDLEVLNRIFRAAHTIKGNSAMLGFADVAQFTHTLEDALDRMRKGKLQVTRAGMTLLLRSLDMLKAKLAALSLPEDQRPNAAELIADLQAHVEGAGRAPQGPAPPEAAAPPASPAAPPEVQLLSPDGEAPPKLGHIMVAQHVISPEQMEEALKKQKRFGEILVQEKFATPDQVQQALEVQAKLAPKAEAASIRVQTEKVDKVINLVGEMVITQSMLTQVVSRFSMDQMGRLVDAVVAMERHSRELQERVMAIRMQPIKSVFGRFPRLVRDLAQALAKDIRLEVSGEETELDKTVIDRIGDPLTHLVRNSVDHGVEIPEVRRQAGKPEQGVVRLDAYHRGGSIFIEIQDDGRGMDRGRILRKAVEQGLVKEGEALTDEQVYALIFRPGFSTAEKVTDVSGRGVGLDVVRRNIESLGGHVGVESNPGHGSKITIKLPLTLAILDGLSVQVGDELYIVPLLNITESIQPTAAQVHTIVGRGEVVDVRGRSLPILRLHALFGTVPRVTDPAQGLLVIVESGGEKVALLVDELVGQHQVVIKSLETNYRQVGGVAGATILGDGRVALILDIPGLVRLAAEGPAVRIAA